jgi:S-(hydroxymethyl)glutathione dehydrogenase/alcohol dehydrogenase
MIEAKAYVLRKTGEIPSLEDIQVSDDLKPGQVMLRVLYSGLCATQMEEIFVSSRNAKYMPHLFGHEGVGVVEALGPGVKTKKLGDICVIHWRPSSIGMDSEPGDYFVNQTKINSGRVVTFTSTTVVPENRVTSLPNSFATAQATLLGCAFPTGWGSLVKTGKFNSQDTVLVYGAGGVGLAALHCAVSVGAKSIAFVEPQERRWPNVAAWSAAKGFLRLNKVDFQELNPSLIIDTSGAPSVIEDIVDWSSKSSRVVLVGMPKVGQKARVDTQKLLDGLQLLGSNGGEVDYGTDLDYVLKEYAKLEFSQSGFVIGEYALPDLEVAIHAQRKGHFWRNILSMTIL